MLKFLKLENMTPKIVQYILYLKVFAILLYWISLNFTHQKVGAGKLPSSEKFTQLDANFLLAENLKLPTNGSASVAY